MINIIASKVGVEKARGISQRKGGWKEEWRSGDTAPYLGRRGKAEICELTNYDLILSCR